MKKRTKKMFLILTLALTFMAAAIPDTVRAAEMTYDKNSKCISGSFDTIGSESITRIEIYVPNAFSYQDDNILLNDISSGALFHLNGDLVTNQGTKTSAEVRYGGIVPINEYQMNCVIYYIISATDISWELKINMTENLSECFVAESKVPTNWETPYDAVITSPIKLLQYFIDSNASSFKSMDDVNILLNAHVQTDAIDESTFDGEIVEEKKQDPFVTILIFAMGVVIVAIIITAYLLKKDGAKKETIRSEKYVAKENEKLKKKKVRENDELKELVSSYDDDYMDEDEEREKEEEEEEEEETAAGAGMAQSGEPAEQSQPVQPNIPDAFQGISPNTRPAHEQTAQVPDMAYGRTVTQGQVQGQMQPMASPPVTPATMPTLQQIPAQTYQPAPSPEQMLVQGHYPGYGIPGQNELGRSVQQQINPLLMGPQYQIPVNQQQQGFSQNPHYANFTNQQETIPNNQRVNQQVRPNPPKKVPAFARKQG